MTQVEVTNKYEYPRLRHCTFIEKDKSTSMYMIVGTEYFEIDNTVGDREKFLEVKRYLDGRHTINEISEITGVNTEDILGILEEFDKINLLRVESDDANFIKSSDFIRQVEESSAMWARQIGYHSLFGKLERQELRSEVFQGLLLEIYHYVLSARKHISVALAHCSNSKEQALLTEFFVDEYDHAKLLLDALERSGISKERAESAHPLIGTLSLVNMLSEIGRQSTFAYFACTSLFEARAEDFIPSKEALELLAVKSGYDKSVVEPVIDHMKGDIEADHNSLLEELLEGVEYISAEEAHFAVNCMHDLKHSFDQFHDQIIQYYSDISNYIPRLKVDYFSL